MPTKKDEPALTWIAHRFGARLGRHAEARDMTTCPWSDFAPATIAFCEARRCAWVVEPSNAWSNLAYVICGRVVLARSRRRTPLVLIGVAAILIGLGSFSFHGTGTRIGELLDVSAMYLLSALAIVFTMRRIWSLSSAAFITSYLGIVGLSVALMIGLHSNGIATFTAQIGIAVCAELYLYVSRPQARCASYRHQHLMIASFALAFAIWNADKLNLLCDPDNHLVTGHAIWHLLTAVAVYQFSRHQDQLVA